MLEIQQLEMRWRIQTKVFLLLAMSQCSQVEELRRPETVVGELLVLMMVLEKVLLEIQK